MGKLIIATANKKKFREIKKILKTPSLEVKSLLDFKVRPRIIENGKTFFENATKKAKKASLFYNSYALGEDSGLMVSALGGRPGIFSARFAGKNSNDKKNIRKLLEALKNIPYSRRKAMFVCCAVFAYKGKAIQKFKGKVNGLIIEEARGSLGFGYDPVFYVPSLKKTLAQVPLKVKNRLSHRYKAISQFSRYLRNYLKEHKGL
jgi:XTP/dITP diphosphohydrolase